MNSNTLILGIQLVVLGLAFILGKFVFPNMSQQSLQAISQGLLIVNQFAASFVTWAKQFMPNNTGEEKMSAVIDKLATVCEKYSINMSEDELRAITQQAYDAMKAQEQAAEVKKVAATGIVPDKMVKDIVKDGSATINVSNGVADKTISIPSDVKVNVVDSAVTQTESVKEESES